MGARLDCTDIRVAKLSVLPGKHVFPRYDDERPPPLTTRSLPRLLASHASITEWHQ